MAEQRRRRRLSALPRVADYRSNGELSRARFEQIVARALDTLPPEIQSQMQNVEVVVAERPTAAELREAGLGPNESMYGFYRGVPLTDRTSSYGFALPDKISIYRQTLLEDFRTDRELLREIRRTVVHEIAHHFGIDDDRLTELGYQ
ncbi:MAG: metallopeptidase family protein [Chloroflexi bacterium]|nr:metallopeptidase family protein [Chloroflexota bacterium]